MRQSEAYKFYMNDQADIAKTGNDRKMLAQALRSLPSLKILSLIDTPASLSKSADYRGGNKVFRQTGTRPINGQDSMTRIQSKEFQAHLVHLWDTLLSALADANESQLRLEEFHTSFCTDINFLTPKQFSIKPRMLTKLSGAFESVSRLHLHLKTPDDNRRTKEMFARFTATLPNLKELSLEFDTKERASGLLFRRFTAGIDLSKLTSLNLTGLSIDSSRLTKSIVQLTQVKDLRLYCVEVTPGSWPPVLGAILKLETLDHLHMMYLRESGCKSYFLKQRDPADPNALGPDFFTDEWDDEEDLSDDDDDDSDGTEGDMPDLQPVDESWVEHTTAGDHADAAGDVSINAGATQVEDDVMSEYVPDNVGDQSERGFYICIEGHEKIARRLAKFIDEYNVGEYMDPADDIMGMGAIPVGGGMAIPIAVGAGPPPGNAPAQTADGFGAFMNAMGLVGLGPLGGGVAVNHGHHPPPFATGAAPDPDPAAGNGGSAANGAAPVGLTIPATTGTSNVNQEDWDDEGGALIADMD